MAMMNTIWAVVKDGKILPDEPIELHDGQRVLVTLLSDEENSFWMEAASGSLDAIWNNEEDDVYAELLAA
jgi:hypothetical protein